MKSRSQVFNELGVKESLHSVFNDEEYHFFLEKMNSPEVQAAFSRYSDTVMLENRKVRDPLADRALAAVNAHGSPAALLEKIHKLAKEGNPDCISFIHHTYEYIPEWVDFDRMEAGLRFMKRHQIFVFLSLIDSLIRGYISRDVAVVLMQTQRLHQGIAMRIFETSTMHHHICNGMKPWEKGHQKILEIRLIHAMVRAFIDQKGEFDAEEHGEPINQMDMCATIFAFDVLSVRALKTLGVPMTEEEQDSYSHLWSYMGYLSGVREELIYHKIEEQHVLATQFLRLTYKAGEEGRLMAQGFIRDMGKYTLSESLLAGLVRLVLGDKTADDLHIKSSKWAYNFWLVISKIYGGYSFLLSYLPDSWMRRYEELQHKMRYMNLKRELKKLGKKDFELEFRVMEKQEV